MIVPLWSFSEVRELEGLQRWRDYEALPESHLQAQSSDWSGWRRVAHLAVFNVAIAHLEPQFIQTFLAPMSAEQAVAFAVDEGFSITCPNGVLRDWFWWSVMIGFSAAGNGKSQEAVALTLERRLEAKLSKEAWLGANDLRRKRKEL
jgi:hypothetical protein